MASTRKVSGGKLLTITEQGEFVKEEPITFNMYVKDEAAFAISFAKLAGTILGLDGVQVKMLLWMSWNVTVNSNEIVLNKAIKERMRVPIKCSMKSIDNSLTKLVKRGMLARMANGVYALNPDAFWRGKPVLQPDNVKLFVNYQIGQQHGKGSPTE